MDVTVLGMVINETEYRPAKAASPISVNPSGRVICVSVQAQPKASLPILVTKGGTEMLTPHKAVI